VNVSFGARTDVGGRRKLNEDAVLAAPPVFLVADGMGGHAAGEVASALAVEEFGRLAGREDLHPADVRRAVDDANRSIIARERIQEDTAGMGTTVSGICLGTVGGTPHWFVFNVGDSRVYLFAEGTLQQLTVDHSEVAELIALGRISQAEARSHPLRNVVTRSLGTTPAPTPDLWILPVVEGERLLVCSDGLPLEVEESEIAAILANTSSAQEAADALVSAAIGAGGRDNVSVVVVDVPHDQVEIGLDIATVPRGSVGGLL
jgi:protein phosphatase